MFGFSIVFGYCVIAGKGEEVKLQILGKKTTQVHLTIIRELPKNTPPPPTILRNLDNSPPGAFYSTLPPPPTIRHKRVIIFDRLTNLLFFKNDL